MIYFIAAPDFGAVKIGLAVNPQKRLSSIQSSCPCDLKLLAVCFGDREVEQALHRQFAQDRRRGEWFTLSPAIEQHIATLAPAEVKKRAETDTRRIFQKVGISQSYASMIATRKRTPPLGLAIAIYRKTGLRFGLIGTDDRAIDLLERFYPWNPRQAQAA